MKGEYMAVAKAKADGSDGAGGGAGTARRRVLIVEDDMLVGMGLKAQLERLGHSVVGQASGAPEAMALYKEHKPDVVLLDIRLDDADGIEVATQLLKERRTADSRDLRRAPAGAMYVHPVTQLEISSTDLRAALVAGLDPKFLMPDSVRKIILKTECYAENP